jgi:fermentation-respiration switch protein FrsA (DUF1100 family)
MLAEHSRSTWTEGEDVRREIEFSAEGVMLRGWLYVPPQMTGSCATIVMAHGMSAVKEMYLDRFAASFAANGFVVLVYDHRNFGASDGIPRCEIDPWAQMHDYRHAITFACTLPEVDRTRIGIWGTSYSGGHVLAVGAVDRRVRCVVSQVPLVSGPRNLQRLVKPAILAREQRRYAADRDARFAGKPPATIAVTAATTRLPCVLPFAEAHEFFTIAARERAPTWRNELTLRSVEMLLEYEPLTFVPRIAPTPLMIIAAAHDRITFTDEALAAFQAAGEPKQLVMLPGGHFDAYTQDFELAERSAREWFTKHLI